MCNFTFCPCGSSDSPCMDTQPRFMPPALSEWIANWAVWSLGEAKKALLWFGQYQSFLSGSIGSSYKAEHVVYVLRRDGHAIILDVEKAML